MSLLVVPALVAAGLLALAGAMKVLDPTMTVGALRALHLPVPGVVVRAGAAAELLLGMWAVADGGPVAWLLVTASYLVFAAYVAVALRLGKPIGSCGCFGKLDTHPRPGHVAANLALAIGAAGALILERAPLDEMADHAVQSIAVGLVAALAIAAIVHSFTATHAPT